MRKVGIITIIGLILFSFLNITVVNTGYAIEEIEGVMKWDTPQLYDGSLYGKIVTVEGTIVNTYNSGKACFLNFHSNWKKYFTAVIFKSDFKKFGTPEDDYYLRKVRVRGVLKEYKGKPEIIVKSPSQIEVFK